MSPPRPLPTPSRLIRAAGAIVWRFIDTSRVPILGQRIAPDDIEVLVIHRPRYDDWSWPKGKTEPGEHIVAAAVREVEEETGYSVTLNAPLTTQRYRLGARNTKEVRYWVAQVSQPNDPPLIARPPVQRASVHEIDETAWMGVRLARDLLTRQGDKRLLDEVLRRALSGQLVTSTLGIVRHAKAQSRSSWASLEATRPLTRVGAQQAFSLTHVLSAFGIGSFVSSPWTRCAATLGPMASVISGHVNFYEELTQTAMREDPIPGRRIVEGLIEAPTTIPTRTVVCGHRPTLQDLIRPLRERTSTQDLVKYPASDPFLYPGQILLTHIARGQRDGGEDLAGSQHVVAIETHLSQRRGNHASDFS